LLCVVKADANSTAFNLVALIQRTAGNNFLAAVIAIQGPAGETQTDVMLIGGMLFLGTNVQGHSHAGIIDGERIDLRLTDRSPAIAAGRLIADRLTDGGKLHKVEREVTLLPQFAPAFDETLHLEQITLSVLYISLALIPQCAAHGVTHQRLNLGFKAPVFYVSREVGKPTFNGRARPRR